MHNKDKLITKITLLSISLMFISGAAIGAALPQIRDYYGLTQTQSELMMTSMSIVKIVFIFLSTFVVRKIGMKKTVLLGLILIGLSGIMPLITTGFIPVLGSRLLLGVGIGLYNALAIRYINLLYEGHTRATLLGFRGSVEGFGQGFLTFLAGLFINISWNMAFLVYLIAFPLALAFYLIVPDVKEETELPLKGKRKRAPMPPLVYLLTLLGGLIVTNGAGLAIRFPAFVEVIQGEGYNSSYLLALMPAVGIMAGLMFGSLNKRIGNLVFYLGLSTLVLANFFVYFSEGRLWLLALGVFISSISGAWCFPYIFSTIGKTTQGDVQKRATSLALVGINLGAFAAPLVKQLLHSVTGSDQLRAPFLTLGFLVLGVIVIGLTREINSRRHLKLKQNSLSQSH